MGTKTLLNGVNDLLKKTESIDSDGALASLTDSSRQVWIDNAIQSLNETVDRLYLLPSSPQLPNQLAEATITLVTADQDYALNAAVVRLLPEFGFVDETNNHIIAIDASHDAYRKLILSDLDQDDTGLPSVAAIRPTDGEIWFDRAPTANENGRVYRYRYERDFELTAAADVFPFTDMVYRSVILAATELYMKINHREFNAGFYNAALAQAAARLSQLPRRRSWDNDIGENLTDPFLA